MNRSIAHLVQRALSSLSNSELSIADTERVRGILLAAEMTLWMRQQPRDQRHAVVVWDRFVAIYDSASPEEQRAALLHDLGKSASALGWCGRIVATLIGGRTEKLRQYLAHEHLGIEMLQGISSNRTIELLEGTISDDASRAIMAADNL